MQRVGFSELVLCMTSLKGIFTFLAHELINPLKSPEIVVPLG